MDHWGRQSNFFLNWLDNEDEAGDEDEAENDDEADEDDFLDSTESPVVERITPPAGKPFKEVGTRNILLFESI